jgi:hypothetical protein
MSERITLSESRRITLSDGSGRWFDARKATAWTGADGEVLYQSVCLLWVLSRPAAPPQSPAEAIAEIELEEAARWLSRNGHETPANLAREISAMR